MSPPNRVRVIQPIFQPEHFLFSNVENRISKYILGLSESHSIKREKSTNTPEKFLENIRPPARVIWENVLNELRPGDGVIKFFYY